MEALSQTEACATCPGDYFSLTGVKRFIVSIYRNDTSLHSFCSTFTFSVNLWFGLHSETPFTD